MGKKERRGERGSERRRVMERERKGEEGENKCMRQGGRAQHYRSGVLELRAYISLCLISSLSLIK